MRTAVKTAWGFALAMMLPACAEDDPVRFRELGLGMPPPVARVPAPLAGAHCEIDVEGIGIIGIEDDYLPHVIQCENGGANLEALKAQAIAARSVAYYSIETSGGICDSQGCQVYSCGADPEPIHYQAVNETSGQYLNYNDTLTYGFFVAGDSDVQPPSCVGVDGATEHWITYNEGRSGTDVEQTELGFVHDPADNGYGQNRGCMGQWSARCLENDNGYDVTAILQFFYGDDIGITQAQGECVMNIGGEESGGDPSTSTTDAPPDTTEGGGTDPGTSGAVDPDTTTSAGEGDSNFDSTGAASSDDGAAGTAGDESAALPGTFGESESSDGCGCSSDGRRSAPLALVLLIATRRRRRGGATSTRRSDVVLEP